MDRNIGDQLNKAFEAYKQASIEKEQAQRDLQTKTEHYEECIRQLQEQIKDQRLQIVYLESLLQSPAAKHEAETKSCDPAPIPQEVETRPPCDHHSEASSLSQGWKPFPDNADVAEGTSLTQPGEEVLDTFRELSKTFQLIQILTRSQNDHLRRIYRGKDNRNEQQQFSMPIQCTDGTAGRAEGPFSSTIKVGDEPVGSASGLASRGASPEDGDLVDSLIRLSVKFPPSADSEYEFLNSAPEKPLEPRMGLAVPAAVSTVTEEQSLEASPAVEVRGPQQMQWAPEFPEESQPSQSPCAFCNTPFPKDHMYSHLNSHFQDRNSSKH